MLVVSDTTPIISLLKIDKLHILRELFHEIIIPEAVHNELTSNPRYPKEAAAIKASDFIRTVVVDDRKLLDVFQRATGLDLGESEAIIFADENGADLLMMDEIRGRQVARQMNIRLIGTLGILQLAYDKNLMTGNEIRSCIELLTYSHHLRLTPLKWGLLVRWHLHAKLKRAIPACPAV